MTFAAMYLLLPILLAVAWCDLRMLRIPNVLPAATFLLFIALAVVAPPPDLVGRLAGAGAVFAIGFLGFALRMVGGGDVKMLPALMLFVPANSLVLFANVFSFSILIGIGAVLSLRQLPEPAVAAWKSLTGPLRFPMGISIALAGIAHPALLSALGA